jgi:hypothetical protein
MRRAHGEVAPEGACVAPPPLVPLVRPDIPPPLLGTTPCHLSFSTGACCTVSCQARLSCKRDDCKDAVTVKICRGRASSKHIMNCFQHIAGSCGALQNPCGGAPQQRRPLTPQHALFGFTPTPTHPSALHTRARPYLLSRHRPRVQRSRVHFAPQHWLLCHLGLY